MDKLSKTATRHLASIKTICYSTSPGKRRHGHDVQVKHYKTLTLRYLQKSLEHAQTHMVRLQVLTISDFAENNSTMQCVELSNNMLQELIMANKGMA